MIELSQQIRILLKTLHDRVYWEIAPQNAVYPYLVYDFQLYPNGEGGELVTLSVDGWDKTLVGDTTAIETLMAKVKTIDKTVIATDDFAVVFFNENMLSITDDDVTLRRRNYNYNGNLRRI